MKIFLKLLSFARNIPRFVVLFIITSFLASTFGVLNLVLLQPLLDILFGQVTPEALQTMAVKPTTFDLMSNFKYFFSKYVIENGKVGGLQFVCVAVISAVVLSNIFRYISVRILEKFKVDLVENLRQKVFENALRLDLSYFSNERKGNLISRITTDIQEVENSIASSFSGAIKEFSLLIGYLVALFYISFKLTLFALIVIPITGVFLGVVLKKMRHDAGEGQQRLGNLMSIMDEAFGGIRIIKAFTAERFFAHKFSEENKGYRHSIFSYSARSQAANPFSEAIGVSMVAGLLLYGGSMVLSNESDLSASMFITFIAIFSQVVRPAKDITQAISSAQRGIVAGQRVIEMLEEKPVVAEQENALLISDFSTKIEVKNVSFAYDNDRVVVNNISFVLEKGKTVALVGSSGGGKSTIADLIPRFYDPTSGEITIDGISLKALSLSSLRSLMGIVTQEAILFNDSIQNNISFGKETTEEEIIAAAKIANAHDFILQQPNGYATVIGDRGTKLSGGQRQRLSIARAILQNPPILLLDEATSALDTESEKLVQEALTHLMKNRTTLVIAHRLSTIQNADEILVIHEGKIIERGTHQSLSVVDNGFYKKLVALQEV
jgi:ATP-binding cassette, subfamily B, bacterial MsbA